MDIFTEAFTYNGDGTFTITEDALREVFTKIHIVTAVENSPIPKRHNPDYQVALMVHETLMLNKVEDVTERWQLIEDLTSSGYEALARYSINNLKG